MNIRLSEVRDTQSGYRLTAKITAPAGTRLLRVSVSAASYLEAGSPEEGPLDDGAFRLLFGEADEAACRERACRLLAAAPQSRRALTEKLMLRGFARDVAENAVAALVGRGYLDEAGQAQRLAELGVKKFYSRRRLVAAIIRRGYTREQASAALDAVGYDEEKVAAALVSSRLGEHPDDDEKRALLEKFGFGD